MKIREIMTANVECVPPNLSVTQLAEKMKALDVGFVPVCENDRLMGTVTDRDIVIRGLASGRDINSCTARDVMTNEIFYCFEEDNVKDVAERMRDKEVRRMLILNEQKRLVGVVSIGDVSKVEEKVSGKVLHDITDAA